MGVELMGLKAAFWDVFTKWTTQRCVIVVVDGTDLLTFAIVFPILLRLCRAHASFLDNRKSFESCRRLVCPIYNLICIKHNWYKHVFTVSSGSCQNFFFNISLNSLKFLCWMEQSFPSKVQSVLKSEEWWRLPCMNWLRLHSFRADFNHVSILLFCPPMA